MKKEAFKLICQNCGSSHTSSESWECDDCGTHTKYECWDCGQKENEFGDITPGNPAKKVVLNEAEMKWKGTKIDKKVEDLARGDRHE